MSVQEVVIFADGEYKIDFIYPILSDTRLFSARNALLNALKEKTGEALGFSYDDKNATEDGTPELLFGKTNRPESVAPEGAVDGSDAYYIVAVRNGNIVISGSDNAQIGLAVAYLVDNYLDGERVDRLTIPADLYKAEIKKDFVRDYWGLSEVPAYPVGANKVVADVYNCGSVITNIAEHGMNPASSQLVLVQKTNRSEFDAYKTKLEHFGYTKEFENKLEENYFAVYGNREHRVHISFYEKAKEARVIYDPKGISISDFGYEYIPAEGERSEFYQYAIPMTNGKGNGLLNCGMVYIIKCADNSVIVIDGGEYESYGVEQMNADAMTGLNNFLHRITGTPDGQTVRISGWYLTHYHSDHSRGFLEFLKAYGDYYSLERIMANIPAGNANYAWGVNWVYRVLEDWGKLVESKYPECKELKLHTGNELQIADLRIRVLYTHEDLLTEGGRFNSADSNDTSTVIRIDNGCNSMIVLGDMGSRIQQAMRKNLTGVTLKSDIVTAAHHMIYHVPYLYKDIAPDIVYISQARELSTSEEVTTGCGSYAERYAFLCELVGEENCYFAGNETVGYASVDGRLTKVYYSEEVFGRKD